MSVFFSIFKLAILLTSFAFSYESHQNEILDKWHSKTLLASGRGGKNFKALDRGVLHQVKEVGSTEAYEPPDLELTSPS